MKETQQEGSRLEGLNPGCEVCMFSCLILGFSQRHAGYCQIYGWLEWLFVSTPTNLKG